MLVQKCSPALERACSAKPLQRQGQRLQPPRIATAGPDRDTKPPIHITHPFQDVSPPLGHMHRDVQPGSIAGEAANNTGAGGRPHMVHTVQQQRMHRSHQLQQQSEQQVMQQGSCQQLPSSGQQARLLTARIMSSADVSELLLTLCQHTQQLDHIHVSAAVKRGCRALGLQLQLPDAAHRRQQQQQQQQHSVPSEVLWLQELQLQGLQQRMQQPLQLQHQEHQEQQQQQQLSRHHMQQKGDTSNVQQQQQHAHWVIQQQLEPQALVQQQLSTAMREQQQQQLPSDSWLLLLLLCQLVQQHSSSMAAQQLCTCLNSLAHLLLANPQLPLLANPTYSTALQQLLQESGQQMHSFDPRGLSLLLHSAAAIARSAGGVRPSQGFMKRWYRSSRAKLSLFQPLDLAMSAWGLGHMGMYPPSQWMAQFWTHTRAAIPQLPPSELLMLLAGMAYTEHTPRRSTTVTAARSGWARAAAQQLQPHLASLTPQQLSIALLAFAKLQYEPSREWLAAFSQAWEAQASQFTAKGHSMVLWAVGAMPQHKYEQQARLEWAHKLQGALQAAVARAATAVAAVALMKLRQAAQQQHQQQHPKHGLQSQLDPADQQQQGEKEQQKHDQDDGHLRQLAAASAVPAAAVPPPAAAAAAAVPAAAPEQPALLSSASLLHPTDCAMAIYALACLGTSSVDPGFTSFWLRQSESQLGNMNSQELSSCLWALGKLRLQPPEAWLQKHLAATAQLAPCMSHRQLAMLLWGCARLQYLPNVLVTAELLMSAAEQLPSFTSHSLCLLVWSLGALRMKPNKEWMALVLKQARLRFSRFDDQDFAGLLLGLYRMRYNPGQQWLDAFTQSMAAKVHLLPARRHALIVAVLRAMGYSCQGKYYAWVMDEAAVAAMCDRDARSSSRGRNSSSSSSDKSSVSGSSSDRAI